MITDDEWAGISLLIEAGWPGDFTDATASAWRVFLGGYTPNDLLDALKRLVARGDRFRPSVAEVVAELRNDPSAPTFDEMMELVFGRGGVLSARTSINKGVWVMGERDALDIEAMQQHAATMHPLVQSFVDRQGLHRLRRLNIDDEEYGAIRRRELAQAWEQHLEAMHGRDIAAMTTGRGNGSLTKLDPLSVLRGTRPVGQLVGGDDQ
jgi:hypothetical protein